MGKPFIETRQTHFRDKTEEARRGRIQKMRVTNGLPIVTDWTPKGEVEARVNYGRWIVDCATGCGGAEFADPDWPLMVCSSGCGAGPLTVTFPSQMTKIEAVLLERPVANNRNWFPSESVQDLERENAEHADEIAAARALGA